MQGIGHVLGPDLSDIGSRVKKPEVLIESIIHPSKVITEGFAKQNILTNDGRIISGSIVTETGRTLSVAGSDGTVTTINQQDIERRVGTNTSPMPDGFATMMTASQLADLTAWLMTQKTYGDRNGFWFQDSEDQLHLHYGEQPLATYVKRHPRLTRRTLVNVNTLQGTRVTRNYPPRNPEDLDPGYGKENGIIHPHMHPGIWVAFGDVDGNDYWRLKSQVLFDGFSKPPSGNANQAEFTAVNRLMSEDGKRVVCVETTNYRFELTPNGYLLHLSAVYQSDERDFYFGDQEESGLAVRVASPIRVQGGNGTILNEQGQRNGAEIWGNVSGWFDYFGTIGNRELGVMVVSHPDNPRPSWLHARDYGVIVTNPFPKQPRERREPYVKTIVPRGKPFQLRYAILIHETDQPLDRPAVAQQIQSSMQNGNR